MNSVASLVCACCVVLAIQPSAISEASAPDDGKPPIFTDLSLGDAVARNADDGRILVIKGTAVWCGPCKRMDATTWREAEVVEWFAERGVALALDVDRHREDAQRLRIRAMPTLIAFKGGEEVDRVLGYQSGEALIEWLDRVSRGETTDSRLDAMLARPREGAGAPSIQDRLGLARELVMAGRLDAATDEYEWLWGNMLRIEPAMVGVRGSFTASEMKMLADQHDAARERFTALRDAAGERLANDPRSHRWLDDWIVLNDVIGDEAATLEWWDRIKTEPDVERTVGLVEFRLVELLERHDRWADLGRVIKQPMQKLAREAHMLQMIIATERTRPVEAEVEGDDGAPARHTAAASLMRRHATDRFRDSAARLYASLLAADRDADAAKIAAEAIRIESVDSELMAQSLVATAIRVDQPRPSQRKLLEPRPLPPSDGEATTNDAADDAARTTRREEALRRLDAALAAKVNARPDPESR